MISYWKSIKNTLFLSLKPVKQASDFILKKNSRWHHCCQIFKTKCSNRNISTSLAPVGANWVSKEAENFKELKFFGLVRCFSVKIAQILKNRPKTGFFSCFWLNFGRFWRFFSFDWKTEHQTKKFKFLEVFRFFWHPVWPQRSETSGAKWFWRQIPLCDL